MSHVSPRVISATLLVVGAVVGSAADRIPPRLPTRAGAFWVLAGDFHVHASPGDGALAPWALRREAARAGLDVIAVTNHNQAFTGGLAERVGASGEGPLMLAGEEITNPGYHMIAVGIERTVTGTQSASAAIAAVHAQGGVAIAAHPSRRFHGYDDQSTKALLDGAELAHSDIHRDAVFRADIAAFFEKTQSVNHDVAAIGSSDFHVMPPRMGRCRTYLFVRERTKQGVLQAIRSGRTLAVDGNGVVSGDPSLVRLMGATRPMGRIDSNPTWRWLSVAMSWLGAFGLVVFAGRRY